MTAALWTGRTVAGRGTGLREAQSAGPWVSGHLPQSRGMQRSWAAELKSSAAAPNFCGTRDRRCYENPVSDGLRRGSRRGERPQRQSKPRCPACRSPSPAPLRGPGLGTPEGHEIARLCFAFPGSRSWSRLGVSSRRVPASRHGSAWPPWTPVPQRFPQRGKQTRPRSAPLSCCGGHGCLEGTASADQPPPTRLSPWRHLPPAGKGREWPFVPDRVPGASDFLRHGQLRAHQHGAGDEGGAGLPPVPPSLAGDRCLFTLLMVFCARPWSHGCADWAFTWLCFPGYLSCCRFLDDNQIVTSSGDTTW